MNYVATFLFSGVDVLLVHKRKGPHVVLNKWNAIGGKVEEGEDSIEAIKREFLEETGIVLERFSKFCILNFEEDIIHFARSFIAPKTAINLTNDVGEELKWIPLEQIHDGRWPIVSNLKWLIPMAIDSDIGMAEIRSY